MASPPTDAPILEGTDSGTDSPTNRNNQPAREGDRADTAGTEGTDTAGTEGTHTRTATDTGTATEATDTGTATEGTDTANDSGTAGTATEGTDTANDSGTAADCEAAEVGMGNQSQYRRNQQQRTNALRSNRPIYGNRKRKNRGERQKDKYDNITLEPNEVFDPKYHCGNCYSREYNLRVPHRRHHDNCDRRQKPKTAADKINDTLDRHFRTPIQPSDNALNPDTGARFLAGEFRDTTPSVIPRDMMAFPTAKKKKGLPVSPADLCKATVAKLQDENFLNSEKIKTNTAPLPMVAFGKVVMEKIVNASKVDHKDYFSGITMTVPACEEAYDSAEYHSIVGQKLLLVDWKKMYGIDKFNCSCGGTYEYERNHFSKNSVLFPIFGVHIPMGIWSALQAQKHD